jgi:hypothetical protein
MGTLFFQPGLMRLSPFPPPMRIGRPAPLDTGNFSFHCQGLPVDSMLGLPYNPQEFRSVDAFGVR